MNIPSLYGYFCPPNISEIENINPSIIVVSRRTYSYSHPTLRDPRATKEWPHLAVFFTNRQPYLNSLTSPTEQTTCVYRLNRCVCARVHACVCVPVCQTRIHRIPTHSHVTDETLLVRYRPRDISNDMMYQRPIIHGQFYISSHIKDL